SRYRSLRLLARAISYILQPCCSASGQIERTAMKSAAVCILVILASHSPCGAFELISEKEAALPGAHDLQFERRGPTRRPDIGVVSPAQDSGLIKSPFSLRIRFRAYGGAKIDRDSIVATYEKEPLIDLTQRLAPYINSDGIDLADAEAP